MDVEQEALDALKTLQAEYLNSVWKTFAALMVSVGWVMSSQQTRDFLEASAGVKFIAVVVVLVLALMHGLTLNDLQLKSRRLFDQIPHTDDQLLSVKTAYEIKRITIYGSFVINGALYLLLLTIIFNADATLSAAQALSQAADIVHFG